MNSIILGILSYPQETWKNSRSFVRRNASVIQMIGFWLLAIAKVIIFIFQLHLILQGETKNLTMSVLLAGVATPLLSSILFSRSNKRFRREESTRSMAWLQKVTAVIFASVSILFIYERRAHNLPVWWEYDDITVQIVAVEVLAIFLFLFASRVIFVFTTILISEDKRERYLENKNRWITHPAREGILMGLIPIAVQIPLGLSFSKYGTDGLSIMTIIFGYVIPIVRMLMLLNTKDISEQGKLNIQETNQAKIGQVIGDCVFLAIWSFWVTTQYCKYS